MTWIAGNSWKEICTLLTLMPNISPAQKKLLTICAIIVISDSPLDISGMDSIIFLRRFRRATPNVYPVMVGDCDGDIKIQLALITRTIEQCFSKSWNVGVLLPYLKIFGNKSSYSIAGTEAVDQSEYHVISGC